MGQFKRYRWGVQLFGPGGPEEEAVSNDTLDAWWIEVRTPAGALVRRIPDWLSGEWEDKANEHGILQFTCPWTEDSEDYFVYPNAIWLYDATGICQEKFWISQRKKAHGPDGFAVWTILAKSLIFQLGREDNVLSYETTEDKKLSVILAELLNTYQTNTAIPAIQWGGMDTEIGSRVLGYKCENTSILNAIKDLHEAVGGYYWVDTSGKLWWKRNRGNVTGQQIRLGKNMSGMEVTEDFDSIRTRIVAKGKGADADTKLTYTANSDTQDTYGVITGVMSDQTIFSEAQLQRYAEDAVGRLGVPGKTFSCEAIDLSRYQGELDYSHEAISVGRRIRLISEALDETIDTTIQSVKRDLASPIHVTITVNDPDAGDPDWGRNAPENVRDIIDVLAALIDKLNKLKNRDLGVLDSVKEKLDVTDWDEVSTWDGDEGTLPEQLEDILDDGLLPEVATWDGEEGTLPEMLGELLDPNMDGGYMNPSTPGSPFDPETPNSPFDPMTPDSPFNPLTDGSPMNASTPGSPMNPSTPGSPLAGIGGCELGTDPPEDVSDVPAVGTSAYASHDDHVHRWLITGETVGDLEEITEGVDKMLGRTDDGKWYLRFGGQWVCFTHIE